MTPGEVRAVELAAEPIYVLRSAGSQSPRIHWSSVGQLVDEVLNRCWRGICVCIVSDLGT